MLAIASAPAQDTPSGQPSDSGHANTISQLDDHLRRGDLAAAASVARRRGLESADGQDPTLAYARLARAMAQQGDVGAATEFYGMSLAASRLPAAAQLSGEKRDLLHLAAASSFSQSGKLAEALQLLQPITKAGSGAPAAQQQMAAKIALATAAAAMAKHDYSTAEHGYDMVASRASEADKPVAVLGAAWAAALSDAEPLAAARKLAAFVESYPQHADAARASRACAACLRRAGREEDANSVLADLLTRWPDSEPAFEVINNQPDLNPKRYAPSIRQWLVSETARKHMGRLGPTAIRLGLIISINEGHIEASSAYTRQLAKSDRSGAATRALLESLDQAGKQADAERIATLLVAPTANFEVTTGAREAACRWAGSSERWSLLALAADAERLDEPSASRTAAIERMFAEALMQTERPSDARPWWNFLVDQREADDFSTLLRCAETETRVGQDPELAARRIKAARAAAGIQGFQLSLVDLLDAELQIRRMKFEEARQVLDGVAESRDRNPDLRCRAQWLIGETYYLQQQFPKAIEAYRRVESIDSDSEWVASALIQAGKSFEHLRRGREASICYQGLLTRFADSSHAGLARRRLAALRAGGSSGTQSSQPTLRR